MSQQRIQRTRRATKGRETDAQPVSRRELSERTRRLLERMDGENR